jgi:hypothetical protein
MLSSWTTFLLLYLLIAALPALILVVRDRASLPSACSSPGPAAAGS